MKTKKIGLLTLALTALSLLSINKINAVTKKIQHNKTITIKLTSMQCNICVDKITEAIKSIDGVVKAKISLSKKEATIKYNADKTSQEEIETAITSAGYDANNKPSDKDAYEKLNLCCKKPD